MKKQNPGNAEESSSLETTDVAPENPYDFARKAKELELAGDIRSAESQYKAAVWAADGLPLDEYRQHCRMNRDSDSLANDLELSRDEVDQAYVQLLALPFLSRLQLAGFYSRNRAPAEAQDVLKYAFEVGLDPLIKDIAAMKQLETRARDLMRDVGDIVGPTDAEDRFRHLFDQLDTDKDGYVSQKELRAAQLDIAIDSEGQELIRYLLYHYYTVEQASKDELPIGIDIRGISKKDMRNFQKRSKASWKRMHKE